MNYLSGAFRYVAGSDSEEAGGDEVQRLIERIKSASLPADRRAAVKALADVASRGTARRAEIGELGLKAFYAVLEQDRAYDANVRAVLLLLNAIFSVAADNAPAREVASTNIDAFLGLPYALTLILDHLGNRDITVRSATVEVLTSIAAYSRQTLQAALLDASAGVSKVCECVDDSHPGLRASAIILLAMICTDSPEVAKIVTFSGVPDKLFDIVQNINPKTPTLLNAQESEDDIESSVDAANTVQDVLDLFGTLISCSPSTRASLRELMFVPRIVDLLATLTRDSGVVAANSPVDLSTVAPHLALFKQNTRNIASCCANIAALIQGDAAEVRVMIGNLAATDVFNKLQALTLLPYVEVPANTPDPPVNIEISIIRKAALVTTAVLVRSGVEFRRLYYSSLYASKLTDTAATAQICAVQTMLHDRSAAMRTAAYVALRESFVMDPSNRAPSPALLNAFTGSSSLTSLVPTASADMVDDDESDYSIPPKYLAVLGDALKDALTLYPNGSDEAAVFYSAALLAWTLNRVPNARERMLNAFAHNAGNSLFPQIMRVLENAQRVQTAPVVRIGLLSLIASWLEGSTAAVSAFLSSSMHLPLVVDILQKGTGTDDAADVHVKGLAAVVLGICLDVTDNEDAASASESGFISGGRGPSMVVPRGTISDVIRNHIGITIFTTRLEDLKATPQFANPLNEEETWRVASAVAKVERNGVFYGGSSIGHEQYYDTDMVTLIGKAVAMIGKAVACVAANGKVEDVAVANRRTSELEARCEELKEMRIRAEEEVASLRKEVESRAEQNIELSGKLYEAEERVASFEEDRAKLVGRLTEAETALKVAMTSTQQVSVNSGEVEEMKGKLAFAEDQNQKLVSTVVDLRSQISEQTSAKSAAEERNKSLESELHALRSQFNDHVSTIALADKQNEELSDLRIQVGELTTARIGAEDRNKELELGTRELKNQVEQQISSNSAIVERNMKLESIVRELNLQIEELTSTKSVVAEQNRKLELNVRELTSQVEEQKSANSVILDQNMKLESNVRDLKSQAVERGSIKIVAEEQNKKLEARLRDLTQRMDEQATAKRILEEQNLKLETSLQELRSQVDEQTTAKILAQDQCTKLEDNLRDLRRQMEEQASMKTKSSIEVDVVQNKLAFAEDQNKKLESSLRDLRLQVEELSSAKTKVQSDLESMTRTYDELSAKHSTLISSYEEQNRDSVGLDSYQALQSQLDEQKVLLDSAQEDNAKLNASVRTLRMVEVQYKEQTRKLQRDVDEQKSRLRTAETSKARLDETVRELEESVEQFRIRVEREREMNVVAQEAFEVALKEEKLKSENLQAELQSKVEEVCEISARLVCSEAALETAEVAKQGASEGIAEMEAELEKYVGIQKELEKARKELADTRRELAKTQDALSTQIAERKSERVSRTLENKIATLESELLVSRQKFVRQKEAYEAKMRDIAQDLRNSNETVEATKAMYRESEKAAQQSSAKAAAELGLKEMELRSTRSELERKTKIIEEMEEAKGAVEVSHEEDMSKANMKLEEAFKNLDMFALEKDKADARVAELTIEVAELKKVRDRKAAEAVAFQKKLDECEAATADLSQKVDRLTDDKAEMETGMDEITRQLREKHAEWQRVSDELSIESARLKALEVKYEEHKALAAEHNELLVCLAELEMECNTLKQEKQELLGSRV